MGTGTYGNIALNYDSLLVTCLHKIMTDMGRDKIKQTI